MRRWAAARPLAVREAPSRQTSVRRTPPDLPCGARPARPLAVHAASFARRVASKPGQALQASHPPPIGPPPFGTADTSPAGLAPLRSGDHDHRHRNLHPNELRSAHPARPPRGARPARSPCGARPARPLAVHAASFARRVASKPGQALQASHHPPIGQSHPMSGTKLPLLRTSNAQPGQNSPHTKAGGSNRYKTLPAGGPDGPTRDKTLPTHHKTAIPSHFSLAGRTSSRLRQRQAEQGELCTAHRTTSGTKLSPHETPADRTGTKLSQQAAPMDPPGTKLSQHETPAVVSRIVV